jgi:hypothetical protein
VCQPVKIHANVPAGRKIAFFDASRWAVSSCEKKDFLKKVFAVAEGISSQIVRTFAAIMH